jgi:hypothetical protein
LRLVFASGTAAAVPDVHLHKLLIFAAAINQALNPLAPYP